MFEAAAIRKLLPYIIAGAVTLGLVVALGITRHAVARWHAKADESHQAFLLEQAHFLETVANFRVATAKAKADDIAHVLVVQKQDAAISQESDHDLATLRTSYRDLAARYASLHRASSSGPVNSSGGGTANMPSASDAASKSDNASGQTIVPTADLGICADAVATAEGWQRWYAKELATPR